MTKLTAKEFDVFKKLHPNDAKIQALTVDELYANLDSTNVDFSTVTFKGEGLLEGSGWDCAKGIGFVVFDCVCLLLGAVSLRASCTEQVAEDIAKAAEPVATKLEQYIKTMSSAESSRLDVATAAFGVISTIYSGSCMGAVLGAFFSSLYWYQYILYAATAAGTIAAACLSGGTAEIGLIVVELATAGFLIDDSIKCADACSYA